MPLKLILKPHEKIIIGGAVITNGNSRTEFIVQNQVPIIRQKDIMTLNEADTPCKKIYLTILLMYIDEKKLPEYHKIYWDLVKDILSAAPSTLKYLNKISEYILYGKYYDALKLTKNLIAYEKEVMQNAIKDKRFKTQD